MEEHHAGRLTPLGAGIAALALAAVLAVLARESPEATVLARLRALTGADVEALKSEDELGLVDATEQAIEHLGKERVEELRALHRRCGELGRQELADRRTQFEDLEKRVERTGSKAFEALSETERWSVWVPLPRDEWLTKQAWEALTDSDRRILGSPTVSSDDRQKRVQVLGREALSEEEQPLFDRLLAKPQLADDPFYAELLERSTKLGSARLAPALQRLDAALGEARRAHLPRPTTEEAKRREAKKRRALGLAQLTPEERDRLRSGPPDPGAATDSRSACALGRALLPAPKRVLLDQFPESDLETPDTIITREGARLLALRLQKHFEGCRNRVKEVRRSGTRPRSLLRSDGATVEVEWNHERCGYTPWPGSRTVPETRYAVHYREGNWTLGSQKEELAWDSH